MTRAKSIAIDGPVASGKTSVGLELAEQLGYLFLDTGIMYRAVTLAVLKAGLDVNDETSISDFVDKLIIQVAKPREKDGRPNNIFVNGVDVTREIRKKMVNDNVSIISTYKSVRNTLTKQQRTFGEKGKVVMVGRDIGTVVLPNADLKIYLNASVEERARRRYQEERERGTIVSYHEILDNMRKRDGLDSTRDLAPLAAATDAILLNTEGKSKDDVIREIIVLADSEKNV